MNPLEKLLSISGEPLGKQPVTINLPEFGDFGQLGDQLLALLSKKNGFYAFESALNFVPATSYEKEMTLSRWNSFCLWRHEYGDLYGNVLFFGEDAFGDQFCLSDGQVCSFDAETGELKALGRNLEQWAERILEEYGPLTGYALMHQWQEQHGPFPIGARLMPKTPFVLGGQYTLDNLYNLASVSAMKSRGNLARQIMYLPDGAQVEFRIID